MANRFQWTGVVSIRRVLQGLTRLGVTPQTPPSDAKYVILTNSICAIGVLVSFVYFLLSFTALDLFLWPSLLVMVAHATPLWLNHRGRHWLATTFLCAAGIASLVTIAYIFGPAPGIQFYFLPILAGLTLIYPPRHWKSALFFVVIAFGAFVSIVLRAGPARRLTPFEPGAGNDDSILHVLALITAGALGAFVGFYSHRQTVIANRRVDERTRELARALYELKVAQAQMVEAENQAVLGRLAAGLLHEMNTPLGVIRSAAKTIGGAVSRSRDFVRERFEPKAPDTESALRSMEVSSELCKSLEASSRRIATVVEGLREFTGLDGSEQKLFDVREGLDCTLALLGAALRERIEVVRDYPEELSPVWCSPAKLNRAFLSILQNGVDAIGRKGGRGRIRIAVREDEGRIEIEVADDGEGIPASRMSEIFDLGFTRKAGRVALRLGLPLSKRHVEEMGGQLTLESVEGEGTTVRLALPIAMQDRIAPETDASPIQPRRFEAEPR